MLAALAAFSVNVHAVDLDAASQEALDRTMKLLLDPAARPADRKGEELGLSERDQQAP